MSRIRGLQNAILISSHHHNSRHSISSLCESERGRRQTAAQRAAVCLRPSEDSPSQPSARDLSTVTRWLNVCVRRRSHCFALTTSVPASARTAFVSLLSYLYAHQDPRVCTVLRKKYFPSSYVNSKLWCCRHLRGFRTRCFGFTWPRFFNTLGFTIWFPIYMDSLYECI